MLQAAMIPMMAYVNVFFGGLMGSSSSPSPAITGDMLSPIIDGVTANIGVIVPVAIGLFAIILGVTMVPKLLKKFIS